MFDWVLDGLMTAFEMSSNDWTLRGTIWTNKTVCESINVM